ncbi:epoxyqueuosine reductase [Desulfocicer vacuolatum DSM 3385]|uniref:Epoxyqueuosine reductase n=1 Tax=Desulfocicer vacuolatum DSM 3385 TaxID=1121400 RepID=A0A1W2ARG7_9BACT|nr:Fe-S protein [Desulfocicer vacuolatum]SMC63285.1 epoxyqueuosine reductase [Desulfocicer vacuolatum DSM 3385]
MNQSDIIAASSAILRKAKNLGAHLSGFAAVDDLRTAGAFTFAPKMPGAGQGVGTRESDMELNPGEVNWPDHARSILVIAVEHPREKPEMDWWFGRISPPGNKILVNIVNELCEWIPNTFEIKPFHFPYHVEKGGIYLKDAAAMAGLGCIGRNNMLVTPEFGPRVRLRAMALDIAVPSTGPTGFNPCSQCGDICRNACPQNAFGKTMYTARKYGQTVLPARDGTYARPTCNQQMEKNIALAKEESGQGFDKPVKIIKYCRVCEQSCPVGK